MQRQNIGIMGELCRCTAHYFMGCHYSCLRWRQSNRHSFVCSDDFPLATVPADRRFLRCFVIVACDPRSEKFITCPVESVIVENAKMHADAVRQSEQTFYGFFGDGFESFDMERSPSSWTSYSLNSEEVPAEDELPDEPTTSKNVWNSLVLQLNRQIIPSPFTTNDLARVSQTPILTDEECSEIINECESHYWGWGSSHERYGTPAHKVGHLKTCHGHTPS